MFPSHRDSCRRVYESAYHLVVISQRASFRHLWISNNNIGIYRRNIQLVHGDLIRTHGCETCVKCTHSTTISAEPSRNSSTALHLCIDRTFALHGTSNEPLDHGQILSICTGISSLLWWLPSTWNTSSRQCTAGSTGVPLRARASRPKGLHRCTDFHKPWILLI